MHTEKKTFVRQNIEHLPHELIQLRQQIHSNWDIQQFLQKEQPMNKRENYQQ